MIELRRSIRSGLVLLAAVAVLVYFYDQLTFVSRADYSQEDDFSFEDMQPPARGNHGPPEKWRPDLVADVKAGQPIQVKPRPSAPQMIPNPQNLPVRVLPEILPKYHYTFTPDIDDPWPKRPEIAHIYFKPDRPQYDPPAPEWPDADQIQEIRTSMNAAVANKDPVKVDDLLPKVPKSKLGNPKTLNQVQRNDNGETVEEAKLRRRRRQWVERAIKHGWEGYKQSAWGHDEVMPISNMSRDPFNGWGASVIDALDLFLMLGWHREYALARTHARAVDFTILSGSTSAYGRSDKLTIPTFETCIRYLGGFLSAYDLSGDALMLKRAKELGDWMVGSFGTQSGLPMGRYRLGHNPKGESAGRLVLAEVGSMTMEFTRLAQLTGDTKYYDLVQRVTDFLDTGFSHLAHPKGLLPAQFSEDARHLRGTYSMGGQADSYYEYLIKEYQLLQGSSTQYARMFTEAIESAYVHLMAEVQHIPGLNLLVIGENTWNRFTPTLTHLTCFAGGMLGLGSKLLDRKADLDNADRVTEACVWAYNVTNAGVAPEGITFFAESDPDQYIEHADPAGAYVTPRGNPIIGMRRMSGDYRGRPETIESVFYMWRLTGDRKWQTKGWSMFQAFVEATAVEGGFAAISHVQRLPLRLADYCESFVFAETLKYYWLLFSDNDVYSLDDYVFNTEAHPFRLRNSKPTSVIDLSKFQDVFDNYDEESSAGLADEDRPIGRGTALQQQQLAFATEDDLDPNDYDDEASPGKGGFGFGAAE